MSESVRVWPELDPGASGLHGEWYAANTAAGRLTIQQCGDCARWRHPARFRCVACQSASRGFAEVGGAGRLINHTITHRPMHPSFAEVLPYAIAVVELDEGPRLLVVVRTEDPAALAAGDRVSIAVDSWGVPHASRID